MIIKNQICYKSDILWSKGVLLSRDGRYFGQRYQQRNPGQLHRPMRLQTRTKCQIYWHIDSPGGPLRTILVSPGPSERRMQTLWACSSDASSGPSLAVYSSMEHGGEGWTTSLLSCTANRASWRWRRLVAYDGWGMSWGCRTHAPPRRCCTAHSTAHRSTANSMAGPGKARPDGDRMSEWMGGCS